MGRQRNRIKYRKKQILEQKETDKQTQKQGGRVSMHTDQCMTEQRKEDGGG